jgi:hypothetical protein
VVSCLCRGSTLGPAYFTIYAYDARREEPERMESASVLPGPPDTVAFVQKSTKSPGDFARAFRGKSGTLLLHFRWKHKAIFASEP